MADVADVVVVGAGAAGCVVASRLAQLSGAQVLLLEAGPDRRDRMPDELVAGWGLEREAFDWGYRSDGEDPVPIRRKRIVGGTGWMTRFALRGSPADYDSWSDHGVHGWAWQDVLPAFGAIETDVDFGDRPWHGATGPIPTTRHLDVPFTEPAQASVEAALAAGFPWVEDHNEPGSVGVGRMPMNVVAGRRITTADVYLPWGSTPPNLTIRGESLVDRIEVAEHRAVAVLLADGGRIETGRVVLCAGVFGSPAILLRSGIGPHGAIVDLSGVGENLADHPAVTIEGGAVAATRREPLLHAVATWHSAGRDHRDAPDLMLWMSDPGDLPPTFSITAVLLRPLARGRVRVRSADPHDAPVIELPRRDDPRDLPRLVEAYRRTLDVIGQPSLAGYRTGVATVPEVDVASFVLDESYSLPHTVGTCALGSVVDSDGSVIGVEGLNVVDASIIPDAPSGFTHIPTVMVAERLASRIAGLHLRGSG
jgi:choline dehydrogenase